MLNAFLQKRPSGCCCCATVYHFIRELQKQVFQLHLRAAQELKLGLGTTRMGDKPTVCSQGI